MSQTWMMLHPKTKGDISTLAIMYGLRENDYHLLVPFGENTRYDLVIDDGCRFRRVQCKTGRLRNGVIEFATVSWYGHHPNPKAISRNYVGKVDDFAVFCHETGGVYLVPIDDLPTHSYACLRLAPPRNSQRRRIHYAAQYEIANLAGVRLVPTPEPGARAGDSGSSA